MIIRSRAGISNAVTKLREVIAHEEPRIARLLGPTDRIDADPIRLQEALDALRIQHEELSVAEEELRQQVDELDRVTTALEAERERYADLFSFAPDAQLVTDARGIIQEANEAAADLLHIDRRFLRMKPLASFMAPAEGDLLHDRLEAASEKAATVSFRMRRRGGTEVLVEASFRSAGHGRRVLWILRAVPAGLPESSVDAQRALRDRTELLERERRIRLDLERSNRAKDRFIAVLAHDLRAPLNAILGWTQLMQREHLDSHGRARALATIERNAHAQARLIEELLDIARLEADTLQLQLVPVDFGHLVTSAVENLVPAAAERKVSLSCSCADELTVIGDRPRLEQILTNVLSNALKFTSDGGRVTVSAERDGDRVRLSVADTGKGIAPDLLPLVFDMYMQDRTRATTQNGLGLGLHIVKQLVELHSGTVQAASEGDGLGTTITITLPLHFERAATPSVKELPAGEPSLARLHVLVVDDEEDERELIGTVLQRAGAEVMSADGYDAALALFESWRPDVLVSDIAMPGVDGCSLLEALRQRDANLAAIAVSGFTSGDEITRALEGGYDAHIAKPIEARELVELVDEAAHARDR